MVQSIRIDFVSDVGCPWCAIGLGSLLQALDKVKGEIAAELHFQPFELNPDMGPEGANRRAYLSNKYGPRTDEQWAAGQAAMAQRGADVGFTFGRNPESRIWNTFDAHRLLHWAGETRADKQLALKRALLKAYFTDETAVSDAAVLLNAVEAAGLDRAAAQAVLESDAFAAEVRAQEEYWRSAGISAVPSVVFNQRVLVQGGQPADVFEQVIRDIAAGKAVH